MNQHDVAGGETGDWLAELKCENKIAGRATIRSDRQRRRRVVEGHGSARGRVPLDDDIRRESDRRNSGDHLVDHQRVVPRIHRRECPSGSVRDGDVPDREPRDVVIEFKAEEVRRRIRRRVGRGGDDLRCENRGLERADIDERIQDAAEIRSALIVGDAVGDQRIAPRVECGTSREQRMSQRRSTVVRQWTKQRIDTDQIEIAAVDDAAGGASVANQAVGRGRDCARNVAGRAPGTDQVSGDDGVLQIHSAADLQPATDTRRIAVGVGSVGRQRDVVQRESVVREDGSRVARRRVSRNRRIRQRDRAGAGDHTSRRGGVS